MKSALLTWKEIGYSVGSHLQWVLQQVFGITRWKPTYPVIKLQAVSLVYFRLAHGGLFITTVAIRQVECLAACRDCREVCDLLILLCSKFQGLSWSKCLMDSIQCSSIKLCESSHCVLDKFIQLPQTSISHTETWMFLFPLSKDKLSGPALYSLPTACEAE